MRRPLPPPLRRAIFFAGGLLCLFLALHLAPDAPSPEASARPADSHVERGASGTGGLPERDGVRPHRGGYEVFSMGNLLALVLLAGGGAWALHLRRRAPGGPHSTGPLEPVGQMDLAPNQQLRLVRCGGEVLLLGVTSGQITLLQRYDPDAFDPAPPGSPMPGFGELLRAYVPRPHA